MYAGEFIEVGSVEDIFESEEHHPYTVGLFGSIPNLESDVERLSPIYGLMPDPSQLPPGCSFAPRCPHCMDICKEHHPEDYMKGTHGIKCFLYKDIYEEVKKEACADGCEE